MKKNRKTDGADNTVMMQTARPTDPYTEYLKFTDIKLENNLYDALRYNVPVIDAAIAKIIRLTSGFRVIAENERLQDLLDDFCMNVPVGYAGKSLFAFIDSYLDSLLTYGNAVGEIIIDNETCKFQGLYNAKTSDIEIVKGDSPLEKRFYKRVGNMRCAIKNPERILFTPLNPKGGDIYGKSVLRGLPVLSGVLMKIYQSIGQNYERTGNVRYAVIYKPPADGQERLFTKERTQQIAEEWTAGMRSSRDGQVCDFITSGDVDIKVIGSDNKMIDTQVPVRQLLEQLISKLSIPPFLLGISWSTTERMSSQQSDILTTELEYYRRLLTPVIIRIADFYLRLQGYHSPISVQWNLINLQDELQLSQARLNNAKALEIETAVSEKYGKEAINNEVTQINSLTK